MSVVFGAAILKLAGLRLPAGLGGGELMAQRLAARQGEKKGRRQGKDETMHGR